MTKKKTVQVLSLADSAEEALLLVLISLYSEVTAGPVSDVDIAEEFMGKSWDEVAYKGMQMVNQLKGSR